MHDIAAALSAEHPAMETTLRPATESAPMSSWAAAQLKGEDV
jgi:hypothetical protein